MTSAFAILSNFEIVKNRNLHISDGISTQLDFLTATEKALNEKWTRITLPLVEKKAAAVQSIAENVYVSVEQFVGTLCFTFFGGKTVWDQTENERLGLTDAVEVIGDIMRIAKLHPRINCVSLYNTHNVGIINPWVQDLIMSIHGLNCVTEVPSRCHGRFS